MGGVDTEAAGAGAVQSVLTPASQTSRTILSLIDTVATSANVLQSAQFIATLFLATPGLICFSPKTYPGATLRDFLWHSASGAIAAWGPTATKFLQWAATRRDLFPAPFCNHAARFQGQCEPDPLPLILLPVYHAIATNRSRSESIIVQPCPFGGGSVAQVHSLLLPASSPPLLARLRGDVVYEESVLKVLRPFVRRRIEKDLVALRRVAGWVSSVSNSYFPLLESVDQFKQMILPQTDLTIEARSLTQFRKNFSSWSAWRLLRSTGGRVIVPIVDRRLSSPEILVETRESGLQFDAWLRRLQHKRTAADTEQAAQLARVGAHMFLKMLLVDNFIHADLHPGNLLVRFNTRKRRRGPIPVDIVLLDGGLTTKLTTRDRVNFVDLFRAIAFGEGWHAGRLILERARREECRDPDGFCTGVAAAIVKFVGPPIRTGIWRQVTTQMRVKEMRIGRALQEILGLSLRYKVELDPAFVGVALAIGILEGVGVSLDPDLDLLAAARPFFGIVAVDQLRTKE